MLVNGSSPASIDGSEPDTGGGSNRLPEAVDAASASASAGYAAQASLVAASRSAIAAFAAGPEGTGALDVLLEAARSAQGEVAADSLHGVLVDTIGWLAAFSASTTAGSPMAG